MLVYIIQSDYSVSSEVIVAYWEVWEMKIVGKIEQEINLARTVRDHLHNLALHRRSVCCGVFRANTGSHAGPEIIFNTK